jgi:hypothetical protein
MSPRNRSLRSTRRLGDVNVTSNSLVRSDAFYDQMFNYDHWLITHDIFYNQRLVESSNRQVAYLDGGHIRGKRRMR